MNGDERKAVAWWLETDGDRQLVCFDTTRGETLVIDVSDAHFGGEV